MGGAWQAQAGAWADKAWNDANKEARKPIDSVLQASVGGTQLGDQVLPAFGLDPKAGIAQPTDEPAALATRPDLTDAAVQKARTSMALRLSATRGLSSTYSQAPQTQADLSRPVLGNPGDAQLMTSQAVKFRRPNATLSTGSSSPLSGPKRPPGY